MALLQSIVLTVFATPIVWVLYGEEYLPAVPILQIITWYSAFSYLGSARGIWFLAEEKQKYIWITNLIGAVINVIGNAILIPLWGACGAAIVSVLTQILTNFVMSLIIKPIREIGVWMIEAFNPKVCYDLIKRK
jgi:O-antigen/teichoic acid export membrane protein